MEYVSGGGSGDNAIYPRSNMPDFNFRALFLVNQERNAYGLRYNDNTRYRKHCANKVHRLRSSLKATHGKGKDFKQLPQVSPQNAKDGNLQLYLFEAERLYTYAQELYAAGDHHKAIAKHRRSVLWADRLLALCLQLPKDKLSASALSEVHVYSLILTGRLFLKRDNFESALVRLTVAHHLLTLLHDNTSSSRDQALADVFGDEISSEIRYCAHELKYSDSYDVLRITTQVSLTKSRTMVQHYDELVQRLKAEHLGTNAVGATMQLMPWTWEGQEVAIRSPELVEVLLRVQEAEKSVGNAGKGVRNRSEASRMIGFDAILQAWSEAEEIAKKNAEVQQLNAFPGARDPQFLHSFVMFHLLSKRMERDLLLVSAILNPSVRSSSTTKKGQSQGPDPRTNQALIKLLDTVLQSLNQIRAISIVDESPDLANQIDASISFIRARRCAYLARYYASSELKRYGEALALTQRARIQLREAATSLSFIERARPSSMQGLPTPTDIGTLETGLDKDDHVFKSQWFSHSGGKLKPEQKEGRTRRPLFFDIALNYVDLNFDDLQRQGGQSVNIPSDALTGPTVVHVVKTDAGQTQAEEKPITSRLGSLLGNWWGRK